VLTREIKPHEAIKNGFALVTEERRSTGIFSMLDIAFNSVISNLDKYKNKFRLLKNKDMDIKDLYGYFGNMNLSQDRTNSVLNYVLNDLRTEIPNEYRKWLRDHTAAVGLSSSKPILDENGNEDKNKSRRVTFRIITNADSKIQQILQQ